MLRRALFLAEEVLKRLTLRDRRQAKRYQPERPAPCVAVVHFGEQQWKAQVCNLSSEGISLETPQPIPVGSLVKVDLSNKCGLFSRTLEVRVLHIRGTTDGHPVFGGTFPTDRLGAEELFALLTLPRVN